MKRILITILFFNMCFLFNNTIATISHPNKLENELAEVSKVMDKTINTVLHSWSKPEVHSLALICEEQFNYLNDLNKPYSVKSASCDDDGIITIEMNHRSSISAFLQKATWTLTPMYVPDDPTSPAIILLRTDEEYEEGSPLTIGISTFRCEFQFPENIQPIDFQFTKPSTEKHLIDVFDTSDTLANTARPLSKYCNGIPRAMTNNE
jgi:hypothetical protein